MPATGGAIDGRSTTVLKPIKHRLKAFTANLKLPNSIQPYAGAAGLSRVRPQVGAILWTHNTISAHLEAVRIIAPQGKLNQYIIWQFEWLTGPERDKFISDANRQYWLPSTTVATPKTESK
jgi:hypothetical protein